MTKLAESYFRIDISLDSDDRRSLEQFLESRAASIAFDLFNQDIEVRAYVEDGSTRLWLIVAGSLYLGIAEYGSFRTGIDFAIKDARAFTTVAENFLLEMGAQNHHFLLVQKRQGVPGQLKRTLRRIERLEQNQRLLNESDYKREVKLIEKSLRRTIEEIDSERDYQLIRPQISEFIRQRLPDRLPSPPDYNVAMRPRDLALPKPLYQDVVETESKEATYELVLTSGTARLVHKHD